MWITSILGLIAFQTSYDNYIQSTSHWFKFFLFVNCIQKSLCPLLSTLLFPFLFQKFIVVHTIIIKLLISNRFKEIQQTEQGIQSKEINS